MNAGATVENTQPDTQAVTDPSQSGKRILLVEDDFGTLTFIKQSLLMDGYQVFSAIDRDEAYLILKKEKPDLIIMDYWMGGMSASVFLDRVYRTYGKVPVLLISAQGHAGTISQMLKIPRFLEKPFDGQQLTEVVREAIPE